MNSIPLLLFLILLSNTSNTNGIGRGPPRIQGNEEISSVQVARHGQEFRLNCPVDGEPSPIIEWFKDGEHITPAWSRFNIKRSSHILRIRSVHLEDSGIYICKGINGFGSQVVKFRLIVVEDLIGSDSKVTISGRGKWKEESDDDESGEMIPKNQLPQLTTETLEQSLSPISLSIGQSIQIRCGAKGVPIPRVTWVKEGKPIGDKAWKYSSWTLVLSKLEFEDSGTYGCVAKNSLGEVKTLIRIHVTEFIEKQKPELDSNLPVNLSVASGSVAVLECLVNSGFRMMPPHVKWLKRVSTTRILNNQDNGKFWNHLNTTMTSKIKSSSPRLLLPVNSSHHVVVLQETPEGRIRINQTEKNGTYLSQLIISSSEMTDSGNYVCIATNSQGYTFREAKLNIFKDDISFGVMVPVPLIVVGVAVLFCSFLISLAYFLRKYHETQNAKGLNKKVPNPQILSTFSSSLSSSTSTSNHQPQNPNVTYDQTHLLLSCGKVPHSPVTDDPHHFQSFNPNQSICSCQSYSPRKGHGPISRAYSNHSSFTTTGSYQSSHHHHHHIHLRHWT